MVVVVKIYQNQKGRGFEGYNQLQPKKRKLEKTPCLEYNHYNNLQPTKNFLVVKMGNRL